MFHPIVRRWFEERFAAPTEPQVRAWPAIASGEDVLVSAPTGSGKTLAAFLYALDGLLRDGIAGPLPDATRVLYVSPLRALSNDVERNLLGPLAGLSAAAAAAGLPAPALRVAVRTGDSTGAHRQAIVRRPPHVLVTTPESLYLLLTGERGRALLASVETLIVDEIHALARDKRGAHLALSIERLEALTRRRPQRIGLSATVEPLDEVARFLVGAARLESDGRPRCTLVEVDRLRRLDLGIEIPDDPLSSVASNELWAGTYDRLAELVRARRSTIVFVNTRRLAERASHALSERLGEDAVAAHHGSLSRERRLEAEERLKAGRLRAIVATSSLELGIDVGSVDLVVQLGSPGALGAGLQRVGRAGHVRGAIPSGRFFPLTRDELVECAALVRGLRRGRLEPTRPVESPLDVLAQQVAAEAAARPVGVEELFALVRRAWPYRALPREAFDAVVSMLAEGVAPRVGRATALLHRDEVNGRVRGRRGTRYAALTGAGAIPDTAQYAVVAEPEGSIVGQVDEDFAVETLAGDVFLLGNNSWRVRRVEATAVRVEDAHGQPPNIPFWNGEAPGRSRALSDEVSDLREALEPRLAEPEAALRQVMAECALGEPGARQLVEYLAAGRAALGALPTRRTWIAERFFDEGGGMQLVVHAPLGARVNRALGLALRKRFCRTFDFELQAAATDEGVLLSLGPQHSFPLETIFGFVTEDTVEEVVRQAVLQAPMFGVRWRWAATRALAIPRVWKGKRIPPPLARMRAEDLLAAVFPAQVACQDNAPPGPIEVPDHPLVEEALRDCLTEAMDLPALRELLGQVRRGEVRLLAVDTREPSPLSHEILGGKPWSYLDDAPLEERRARMVAIRRALPEDAASLARLDPAAVSEVSADVWPDVRDPDELHDALLELGLLPEGPGGPGGLASWPPRPEGEGAEWERLFGELAAAGRATRMRVGGLTFWIAAERVRLALSAPLSGAPPSPSLSGGEGRGEGASTARRDLDPPCSPLATERAPADADDAALRIVRGWVPRVGPFTAESLAGRIGLPAGHVARALLALEADGLVLRGRFLDGVPWSAEAPHFCERTVLSRIHRLTLGRLRDEIEPVATADLIRFLLRWQHVAEGTRLHGARGLAEVVGQLQGFHAAAGAWERGLLAARLGEYQPALLDGLCLSGEVAWGRLSGPLDPAEAYARAGLGGEAWPVASGGLGGRASPGSPARMTRRRPTRAAPVTLVLREDLDWLLAVARPQPGPEPSDAVLLRSREAGERLPVAAQPQPELEPLDATLPRPREAGERVGVRGDRDPWLSPVAREVAAVLGARGASFPSELSAATRYPMADVEEGLSALVVAGLATCDGFAGLRALIAGGRRPHPPAPSPASLERGREYAPSGGRWSLLRSHGADGEQGSADPVERLAQQYLRRYGVVFRDLLAREDAPPWRELVRVYRTLEARGSIRGGRFVAGRSGEQFALPEAVDALRAVRRLPRRGAERVELSAADPLNLVGILTPGPRIPAQIGGRVAYVDGIPAIPTPSPSPSSVTVTGSVTVPELTPHPSSPLPP